MQTVTQVYAASKNNVYYYVKHNNYIANCINIKHNCVFKDGLLCGIIVQKNNYNLFIAQNYNIATKKVTVIKRKFKNNLRAQKLFACFINACDSF
jgi:hypothetical protein